MLRTSEVRKRSNPLIEPRLTGWNSQLNSIDEVSHIEITLGVSSVPDFHWPIFLCRKEIAAADEEAQPQTTRIWESQYSGFRLVSLTRCHLPVGEKGGRHETPNSHTAGHEISIPIGTQLS